MASLKMISLWAFLLVVCWVAAISNATPEAFIVDDGEAASPMVRVPHDDKYFAAASGGGSYGKGHVGPVYTFVKTDPKANFKWGVRHRAGVQYGGR